MDNIHEQVFSEGGSKQDQHSGKAHLHRLAGEERFDIAGVKTNKGIEET